MVVIHSAQGNWMANKEENKPIQNIIKLKKKTREEEESVKKMKSNGKIF